MEDSNTPWEQVTDPSYFRGVMLNLTRLGFGPKHEGKAYVRFGATGIGHAPHYQIESDENVTECFRGPSHKPFAEEEFNKSNISQERFSYSEVRAMLEKLL